MVVGMLIVSQHIIFILREVFMKQTREWSFAHVCSTINIPAARHSGDTHCFNLEWNNLRGHVNVYPF